jgi:hypothetical protein
MSDFRKLIFATPIYAAVSDNTAIQDLICRLVYKWKEDTIDKAISLGIPQEKLSSYYWNLTAETGSRPDWKEFGMTTFYTGDLIKDPNWLPVKEFIENVSASLLSEEHKGKTEITMMWATIYPKGAHVPEHIHNNSLFSGVFYAKTSPFCGNLIFKDPAYVGKTMASKLNPGFPSIPVVHEQEVENGLTILFPSWLPHSTQSNGSDEDRIIVSFNLNFPN